jgi:hypothetical protein
MLTQQKAKKKLENVDAENKLKGTEEVESREENRRRAVLIDQLVD